MWSVSVYCIFATVNSTVFITVVTNTIVVVVDAVLKTIVGSYGIGIPTNIV